MPPCRYVTLRNLSLGREALALITRKRSDNGNDYYRQPPSTAKPKYAFSSTPCIPV